MNLSDFLPYVLPGLKGCTNLMATQQLRLALIELCKRSLVWREFQASQNTVANQTAYSYTPAAGQQVVHLLGVKVNGIPWDVVDAEKGKRLDDDGSLDTYAYGKLSGFELHPAQAAGQPIITYSAVAPSLTATTVPDAFGKYLEGIVAGTKRRLYAMPGAEFNNEKAAADLYDDWERCIGEANDDALKGHGRTSPRVQAHWF